MTLCPQEPNAVIDPNDQVDIPREEAQKRAMAALQTVLDNGPKIELDHHLVYYTRMFFCSLLDPFLS